MSDELKHAAARGGDARECEANDRLIAAAPELLAALKEMTAKFVKCARSAGSDQWAVDAATASARDAIAKAEGRAP